MDTPYNWHPFITSWKTSMRAAALRPDTIDTRVYQITRLAHAYADRDPLSLTTDDLLTWMGSRTTWARETRRQYRATLRGFYDWAVKAGHLEESPAAGIPIIRATEPCPRPAPQEQVEDALTCADPRTALMIRLSVSHGLRRGEVARVHADDVEGYGIVAQLRVRGKGGKVRVVPIRGDLAARIRRQAAGGYLFPGQDDGHLSPRWVGRLVRDALGGKTTMHQLRHLAATETYLRSKKNLLLTQQFLGHSSPATTQRYVLIPDDDLRKVMEDREADWDARTRNNTRNK